MKCVILCSLSDLKHRESLKCRFLSCLKCRFTAAVVNFVNKCFSKVTKVLENLKVFLCVLGFAKNGKSNGFIKLVDSAKLFKLARFLYFGNPVDHVSFKLNEFEDVGKLLVNDRNVKDRRTLHMQFLCVSIVYNLTKILLMRSGDIESNPGPNFQAHTAHQVHQVHQDRTVPHQPPAQASVPGKSRKSDLQVMSYNIRGLNDRKKVRHVVNSCYKLTKKAVNSFFMFQETFVTRLDILKYLWRGEYHLTPGLGNSQGCVTLVTAPFKIIRSTDLQNRAHVLVLTKDSTNNAELILVNVYAPNGHDDEKVRFFEELMELVNENIANYNCENVVLGGDLNLIFSANEVNNRLYTNAEQRIAAAVKVMFQQANLIDAWEVAPMKKFTWRTNRTGLEVSSTLDRIMYWPNQLTLNEIMTDWSLSLSDHAAVTALFQVGEQPRRTPGTRIARLDPRLLLDPEGREILDASFRELIAQASPDWNPHVRLEYLKMCLRTAANEANGKLKARMRDTELDLNNDINKIVEELSEVNVAQDRKILLMTKLDDLRQLKRTLVEKVGTLLEQRTARKWYNEGELSNKYFFNLLNRKSNDEINAIIDANGTEVKDPKIIEELIASFYKDLYESVPAQIDTNDEFFRHVRPVEQDEANAMEAALTLEELTATLKTCSDSSPGPDGIPYSYLKHYWEVIGPVLLSSWHYSLANNELPNSHQVSYLRLIPKVGKDPRVISNLRPITLSNTDHKLITKTYARKLTGIVGNVVGGEQTAYIPGRLINDNIRAMLSTIDLANLDDAVDGVLVSLDAKKAFDSVDHRYIKDCLRAFGLACFVPIFDVLYKDLKSQIIVNGKTIDGYKILKGVKQGDALSCVLFILCMEPLIKNIKSNVDINRVESRLLPITLPKVYGFADDISVAAKNSERGVQAIFSEYEQFTKVSGLHLNANKTELLCFNKARRFNQQFRVTYLGTQHVLTAVERIKINGILFTQDPEIRENVNVMSAIEAMERLLLTWSTRRLTLLGRILIVKTYAISKLIYIMQSLMLSERSYKAVIKVIFKYMWNKNLNAARAPERLKRSIMMAPRQYGGFGMVDVVALGNSLDLRAYARLLSTSHPFFCQVRALINSNDFFNVTATACVDSKTQAGLTLLNKSRKEIFNWPLEVAFRNASLSAVISHHKLKYLLKPAGRQSLNYFVINNRVPNPAIHNLTPRELQGVIRHLKYPGLVGLLTSIVARRVNVMLNVDPVELMPTNEFNMARITTLTSKMIRTYRASDEDQMINVFKLGPILNPGEVLAWTKRMKLLTSTRHKNILLRAIHGDIFSNARMSRFGLTPDPKCLNCPEPSESSLHRLKECPRAIEAWVLLEEAKTRLGLQPLSDLSIENLLGAKDQVSKLELTLNAELIHKLASCTQAYCPRTLVMTAIKFISFSENLDRADKDKFKRLIENGL